MPAILRPLPALLLSGLLVLALCAAGSVPMAAVRAYFPLDAETMALGAGGQLVRVFDPRELVPGTRVLRGTPDTGRLVAEQQAWLAAGRVPTVPELGSSSMTRDALLDLHVLSRAYGVPVAGWAPAWRYLWPRDAALAATALARTGHPVDAERVISFLQRVQPAGGVFEARYRPDGTGVPDGRGPQTDSLGWALWAMDQVTRQLPAADRRPFVQRHRSLLTRSVAASLTLVDNPRSLPPPSSDYWEVRERRLTLSTVALLAAGLRAGGSLEVVIGDRPAAQELAAAADRVTTAITTAFARDGFPRTIGGPASSVDLGVSYLLPPFVPANGPADAAGPQRARLEDVWRGSATRMARAAGGLAPGGSWPDDGVSWNTATSSHALTSAFVDDRLEAVRWLRWLDAHRTAAGSLPEKVLADGSPASVAPLAWPAAAVLIAADELSPAT